MGTWHVLTKTRGQRPLPPPPPLSKRLGSLRLQHGLLSVLNLHFVKHPERERESHPPSSARRGCCCSTYSLPPDLIAVLSVWSEIMWGGGVGRHATEVGRSIFNTFVKKVCMYVFMRLLFFLTVKSFCFFPSSFLCLALRNSVPFCS